MVLMTMIGRVADGLPLAASVHNDMRDEVKTNRQCPVTFFGSFFSRDEVEPNIKIKQKEFFVVSRRIHRRERVSRRILISFSKFSSSPVARLDQPFQLFDRP